MTIFYRSAPFAAIVAGLLLGACASNPADVERQKAIDEEIAAILAEPLDPAVYGETKRCLTERESRDFRAIGDEWIVFSGHGDKLWLNTLIGHCPDLRWGDTLRIRSVSWTRICEMDRFVVSEWFEWPWYRRWPWQWGGGWSSGMPCTLGKFQPVTLEQVDAIERALKSR